MSDAKRPVVIVANWKMYKTIAEAKEYVAALEPLIQGNPAYICLAPPFTALSTVAGLCIDNGIIIGGQNMYDADEGAFTGEISGNMLKDAGAKFVILGHSERRRIFHETNDFINKKLKKALALGLQPILCIGETLAEREHGSTIKVLTSQLRRSLADLTPEQVGEVILAYEPIWAIGSNETATPQVAEQIHAFCRKYLGNHFGIKIAEKMPILYGGSVKPENTAALMEQKNIDGLLVGSASLSPETFGKIIQNAELKHLNLTRETS